MKKRKPLQLPILGELAVEFSQSNCGNDAVMKPVLKGMGAEGFDILEFGFEKEAECNEGLVFQQIVRLHLYEKSTGARISITRSSPPLYDANDEFREPWRS